MFVASNGVRMGDFGGKSEKIQTGVAIYVIWAAKERDSVP